MRSLFATVLMAAVLIGCATQTTAEILPSDGTASAEATASAFEGTSFNPEIKRCYDEFDRAGATNKAGGTTSAQLANCDFRTGDFSGTMFALINADLSYADLADAIFGGGPSGLAGNFVGANFTGANLIRASFDRANFNGANFTQANFLDAKHFYMTNFENANLTDAINLNVNLLDSAILCNTTMPNGKIKNRDCGKESQNYYDWFTGGDDNMQIFP